MTGKNLTGEQAVFWRRLGSTPPAWLFRTMGAAGSLPSQESLPNLRLFSTPQPRYKEAIRVGSSTRPSAFPKRRSLRRI